MTQLPESAAATSGVAKATAELERRIAALEKETEALRRDRNKAQAVVREIYASRSWRVAQVLQRLVGPVRSFAGRLRRDPIGALTAGRARHSDASATTKSDGSNPARASDPAPARQTQSAPRAGVSFDALVAKALMVPTSANAAIAPKHKLSVAIVTDVYMYNFYKGCFRQTHVITPENYEDILLFEKIDLFIYVTCWRGVSNDEWRGHIKNETVRDKLDHALDICQARQIPTLFHSIEDPSNFEHFLPLAKRFQYIATTDSDCVEAYKRAVRHDRVAHAEYGVNPLFNNPLGMASARQFEAFFAGSYPKRYAQRCKDMELIFDSLTASGVSLTIADRNYQINQTAKLKNTPSNYDFPERFDGLLIDALPHDLLQRAHKCFGLNINLNSITRSPTMGAMRVYELQAQGTLLVSNYALSTSSMFPDVDIVAHPKDLTRLIRPPHPLQAEEKRQRMVRSMLSEKTAFETFAAIARKLPGLAERRPVRPVKVCIVKATGAQYEKQKLSSGAFRLKELDWSNCSADALKGYDFIAFFTSDHSYEEHYLQDALNCFKFVDVDFVTVSARFAGGQLEGPVYDFVPHYNDIGLTVFNNRKVDVAGILAGPKGGTGEGFAGPPFSVDYTSHLASYTARVASASPRLSIVVPVFNNGTFLERRCFASLLTNAGFYEFEILLIDDGSTDAGALETLQRLDARYANVRTFRFEDGPSGSASRPRNKGVEMASAPDVTFLDPDNAMSPGGYDALLKRRDQFPQADAILGYQLKLAEKIATVGKIFPDSPQLVERPRESLIETGRFPVISTQCALLRTDFLRERDLNYIVGAVGQDTTFGYEVLASADNGVVFVHDAYLEYFSERPGSVTNSLDPEFFRKSLTLENEQRRRFLEAGIWDAYLASRAKNFVEGWYLKKFSQLSDQNKIECKSLVEEIFKVNQLELPRRLNGEFSRVEA